MPFDCRERQQFGESICRQDCRATRAPARFEFARVERAGDLPPTNPRTIDVAILDMHHGWPNLGHAAIVHALQNATCDIRAELDRADLTIRAVSYDVRRGLQVPDSPPDRHRLYVGTGGPGHLDPSRNDGVSEGSQGILENPAWERPLFRLFDRIRDDRSAALLGVCHTFGVMCRWLGVADAVLRSPAKGGKSTGIVENVLVPEAVQHPWFGRFAAELPDHRHMRVLDNRLYDLLPRPGLERQVLPISRECEGGSGGPGEAITMIEVERDGDGIVPRVFGVNHHPEVVNRPRMLTVLLQKLARGEVREYDVWFQERLRTLTQPISDEHGDRLLQLASSYTFHGPMRFHLYRLVRQRAQTFNVPIEVDEHLMPIAYSLTHAVLPLSP
jgi:hypothetical protein